MFFFSSVFQWNVSALSAVHCVDAPTCSSSSSTWQHCPLRPSHVLQGLDPASAWLQTSLNVRFCPVGHTYKYNLRYITGHFKKCILRLVFWMAPIFKYYSHKIRHDTTPKISLNLSTAFSYLISPHGFLQIDSNHWLWTSVGRVEQCNMFTLYPEHYHRCL